MVSSFILLGKDNGSIFEGQEFIINDLFGILPFGENHDGMMAQFLATSTISSSNSEFIDFN
ncbi:MAG: hypothetical protein GEU26_03805 [Nitrososphaeraceae archaeon]|nr:hypothetical protein [Nitrososphaeraceae archaeon]